MQMLAILDKAKPDTESSHEYYRSAD
jgi:hypothetical protein